jgi:hypothetical protein
VSLFTGEILVVQNEDYSHTWGFATADPSGILALAVPISFAGSTAKLQVREGPAATSTELLALSTASGIVLAGPTTISGVSCGTITIAIANAVTAALLAGAWFYDLFVITASGQQTCFMQGSFMVVPTVTR